MSTTSDRKARTLAAGAAAFILAAVVAGPHGRAQTDDGLERPGDNLAALHARAIMGEMRTNVVPLSPCLPGRAIAFEDVWPGRGVWAGEFRVMQTGTGGEWRLRVEALDGNDRWEAPLTDGIAEPIATRVLKGNAFRVSLLGPGVPTATCAKVRLERELEPRVHAEPRGQVGPDDRWDAMSPSLSAETDAQAIRSWGASVAHLQVLTSTNYLIPCTGFFITPRVLVTAAHCIPSSREAAKSTVFLEDREIPGSEFQLLIAQGDELDFTMLWLKTMPVPINLRVGTAQDLRLVIWQQPLLPKKVVSVQGCGLRDLASAGARRVPHLCDTEPGSSGSPVQSRDSGTVIGLHTLGCSAAQNGQDNCVNYAINFRDIRRRVIEKERPLRARNAQATDEILAALGPPIMR